MTTFKDAVKETPVESRTNNGMRTNDSSLNACINLFFQIGASRGNKNIITTFERAYQEDRVSALRIAAWARDVRGGAGERDTFRNILQFIETNHLSDLALMLPLVPVYGRWDDLFAVKSTVGRKIAFNLIKDAFKKGQIAQRVLGKIDSMSEEECQKMLDTYT